LSAGVIGGQAGGASGAQAPAGTLAPEAFVQKLATAGRITDAQGRTESVGGFPAWVGRVSIPQDNAAAVVAAAGWIRRADTLMFQVLGRSQQAGDANDAKIYASLRSFRAVTDPSLGKSAIKS
jgi:hypothetical protein